jgi:ABC-2 type transport system permease protein
MKKILAIALKDTLQRFSSPSEWLTFIVLPVVFILVIFFASGAYGDSRIPLLVVDQDGGKLARDLVAALGESKTVKVKECSLDEAESQFRNRQAPAMLVIPAGMDEAQVAGNVIELQFTEAAGNTDAIAVRQAVQAVLVSFGRVLQTAGISLTSAEEIRPDLFADTAEREKYYLAAEQRAQTLFAQQPDLIYVTHPTVAGSQQSMYSPQTQASAGQLITWVFIPLLAISALFALERRQGTLRRMISAPVSKAIYLLGTITGQLGTALVQMLILSVFGAVAMGVAWWRTPLATVTMFLSFGLASVSFGTMLGTFVRSEAQASGISVALGMVMALLGGCWFPLELFPPAVQKIVLALPTTWAMIGMNDIVLRGQGLAAVLPEAGVLLGFAAVFFAVGVWRFKYE